MTSLVAKFVMPPKFRRIYRRYHATEFSILDVGCGNHSPSVTKKYFPRAIYHGIDREDYNVDANDARALDTLYRLDLNRDSLDTVPNGAFDVVIANHVIEHTRNPAALVAQLVPKLKVGGTIYLEFPSLISLGLTPMEGTLQFCDDPTHFQVPDPYVIANTLLEGGVAVLDAGIRRDTPRVLAAPVYMAVNVARRLAGRRRRSRGLCDVTGFAFYIYGEKRENWPPPLDRQT